MRHLYLIPILLTSLTINANLSKLPRSKRYRYKSNKMIQDTVTVRNSNTNRENKLQKLKVENSKLKKQLSKIPKTIVHDNTSSINLTTGTVIKGILLNSIKSTNLASPISVRVLSGQKIPEGSLFDCRGTTHRKSVITSCDLVVIDEEEYEIAAVALNLSGAAGLRGEYYDGKEEAVVASVGAEFIKAMAELGTERATGGNEGQYKPRNTKNLLLGSATNAIDKTSEMILDNASSKEPVVFVPSGKVILIRINRRFNI